METNSTAPLPARTGRLTLIFIGVVLVTMLATYLSTEASPTNWAPEIVIAGFDGTTWSLHQHLDTDGRPVIVNFWASWCVPCRIEIPEISAFASSHPEILVVGVAVEDSEKAARQLMDEMKPTYYVGIDPSGLLRDSYPSFGLPVTFLVGPDGAIAARREGIVSVENLEEMISGLSL